jgi:ABC-type amino acid transport substrate-binding protein
MEEDRMRRKISTLLMISAVILSVLLIPTVLAEKPTIVSGTWSWWADAFSFKYPGGNTFISATEHDTLTGTFEGSGVGPFIVRVDPNGVMTGIGRTVFTGFVGDNWGTLVIQWN